MPASLIIEGLAQTGGILVGEAGGFAEKVVLAKIPRAEFHGVACAGDQLIYEVTLTDLSAEGAAVEAKALLDGELLAEAEIVFAHLDNSRSNQMFGPKNFVFTQQLLGVLDLAKAQERAKQALPDSNGQAVECPPGRTSPAGPAAPRRLTSAPMLRSERRVVITGLGLVTPIGIGADAYWAALAAGRGGVDHIKAFGVDGLPCDAVGEDRDFDPAPYAIPKHRKAMTKSLKYMARDIQLAVAAAQMAVADAGLADGGVDPTRIGVDLGAGLMSTELDELAPAMSHRLRHQRQV